MIPTSQRTPAGSSISTRGDGEGKLLESGDMVICADAKPSIQARGRIDPTAPRHRCGRLVEHESERLAAVTYFAASHLRPGQAIGRTEPRAGLPRLTGWCCRSSPRSPIACPPRVFWIAGNGSDRRREGVDQAPPERPRTSCRNLRLTETSLAARTTKAGRVPHPPIDPRPDFRARGTRTRGPSRRSVR